MKPTQRTKRTGESRPKINKELEHLVYLVSNNSHLTNDTVRILTNSLDQRDTNSIIEWLRLVHRIQLSKETKLKRTFR